MGVRVVGTLPQQATLVASRDDGDGLSVWLAESGASPTDATCSVEVYARTTEAELFVGSLTTVPQAAGSRASRLVAVACVPGARAWSVVARGSTAGYDAEVYLSAGQPSGGPGLVPLDAAGRPTVP